MTVTEKILARVAGMNSVAPDDIIEAKIDVAMINDLASPGVISSFNELSRNVWDPNRVVIVLDHSAPAFNQWAAEAARLARDFHKSNNLTFCARIGRKRKLVFGKYSGRSLIKKVLEEKGIHFEDAALDESLQVIKETHERKEMEWKKENNALLEELHRLMRKRSTTDDEAIEIAKKTMNQ